LTAGAGFADGLGGEVEKDLSGERVVPGMEWLESGGDIAEIVTAGKTAQGYLDRSVAVFIGRAVLRRRPYRTTLRLRRQRPSPHGQSAFGLEQTDSARPSSTTGARLSSGMRHPTPKWDVSHMGQPLVHGAVD
jgi:hypothetical protein